jgi:3D (Asp-Asp-Asp) domain-containing protein
MYIYIERSTPITIVADGHTIQTRTHQKRVGQALAEAGIPLMGQDYSRLPLERLISAQDVLEVVRVREGLEIEEEFIPFETQWIPDENLELDQQQVRQEGVTGVIKTRSRVRYENEQEVWRAIEDEWLDQEPRNRVVAYGTRIVVRTLETERGTIEYWRKIPMLVTAYNAASSGKAYDHPRYGITRSGLPAGYGVVAVDPRVIRLRANLYIPGYGQAIAGDTGGTILGKHLDLGFDDDEPLPTIYEWRDVYVLTPVPPPDQIRYVLPQWPQR